MIYKELEHLASQKLESSEVFSGHARYLMLEMLQSRDLDMFALFETEADADFVELYESNIDKLCQSMPISQVLGYQWFYGYQFDVNEDVLTPREETEELVGEILMYVDDFFENPRIVDVATGSGAIAITLSKELGCHVDASDISVEALVVARNNNHKIGSDVTFVESDMLNYYIENQEKYDVLICNPPYIKADEVLDSAVIDHEPHIALFGGHDGLFFYRQVLENASKILNPRFMIAFEIGFDIGQGVVALAQSHFPDAQVILKQDMNGLDRMVFVIKN